MDYYVALLVHQDYYEDYVRQMPTHRDHQLQWAAKHVGRVVACGTLAGSDVDQLWLLQAESKEEAQGLVQTSPDVMRNLARSVEVAPWHIRWGRIG